MSTSSSRAGAKAIALLSATCRHSARQTCRAQHLRSLTTTPSRLQTSSAQKVSNELFPSDESEPVRSLTDGLQDPPPVLSEDEKQVDWTRSFHGLSSTPFTPEQAEILQAPLEADDIEIKPDGIVYLPEIKYRRKLNKAFGPGGWGLAPRGETIVTAKVVTREYGLICGGRLVSIARGEQQYFDPDGIPTATEGCKSNALMRCCKDLGIASELWDPRFIRKFMAEHGKELLVEHALTKKKRKHFMRKDETILPYPWKEVGSAQSGNNNGANSRNPGTGTGPAPAARRYSSFGSGVASAASQAFQKAKAEANLKNADPVKAAP